MLEPDWNDLQEGFHLPSTIITTLLVALRPDTGQLREFWAHCKPVACRTPINIVSTSFDANGKSLEIIIVNNRERIDKIIEEEEEATPHKWADLETWLLCVRNAFADLFKPLMGTLPASKHDFCIDTDPTAKMPHHQLHQMSDSEHL